MTQAIFDETVKPRLTVKGNAGLMSAVCLEYYAFQETVTTPLRSEFLPQPRYIK